MRVLFVHPDDHPEHGPWRRLSWDRVIDLGMGGAETYSRWRGFFQCPVTGLDFARISPEPVREALAAGSGYLRDSFGVDWWEILSVFFAQQLCQILALEKIARTIAADDQVFITRSDFQQRALEALLGRNLPALIVPSQAKRLISRGWDRFRKLTYAQVKQVVGDKYDPEYRVRRRFCPPPVPCPDPVVLLPSAYVNVSRMALAYAKAFPGHRFLLINARQSGWCESLPDNVVQGHLASYVGAGGPPCDYESLALRWRHLQRDLRNNPLLNILIEAAGLDGFDRRLRQWLKVRDAWLRVFQTQNVQSVLSCDDSNPYTQLPVVLAKRHGLPTAVSHHGALDAQNCWKHSHADAVLAKGLMERDYLVHYCGLPPGQVKLGAPVRSTPSPRKDQGGSAIVFFSEDYEVSGARVEEFYRDVLPRLAMLAQQSGKQLILKLHPAESVRDRRRLVRRVLSPEQRRSVQIVHGPLTEEFMQCIWFAVTVISTTAVDCALQGIPVFLCEWLENWPFGYFEQFVRFGVGVRLHGPADMDRIPTLLANLPVCDRKRLWQPIEQARFEAIFSAATPELAVAL